MRKSAKLARIGMFPLTKGEQLEYEAMATGRTIPEVKLYHYLKDRGLSPRVSSTLAYAGRLAARVL